MKPSVRVRLDFSLAAITAASVPGGDPADTARIAWEISYEMMEKMPKHVSEALRRADEVWESAHE